MPQPWYLEDRRRIVLTKLKLKLDRDNSIDVNEYWPGGFLLSRLSVGKLQFMCCNRSRNWVHLFAIFAVYSFDGKICEDSSKYLHLDNCLVVFWHLGKFRKQASQMHFSTQQRNIRGKCTILVLFLQISNVPFRTRKISHAIRATQIWWWAASQC